MNRMLATALIIAGLAVGACSSAATPAPSAVSPVTPAPSTGAPAATPATGAPAPTRVPAAPGSPAAGLDGRTFLSVKVAGHDLVTGSTVSLTFKGPNISAHAGCNAMGGAFAITGTTLSVGPMMSTEMGCDAGLMAQDQWLAAVLTAGPTFALDGDTLTLSQGQTTITLEDRTVVSPDRPLEGTTWVLAGIVSSSTVSSVPVGLAASITVSNGTAAVNAGCNTGSTAVKVDGDTITFGPLALTTLPCPNEASALEQSMRAVLTGTVKFTIVADALTLDGGANGLAFLAAK